ncbi:MAG: hypothetical protein HQL97_01300 [Magnetococcales bacterium]|nr:hypothetical protein [Magnetococcales bacterium]
MPSIPSWPSALPQKPTISGFGVTFESETLRTDMEAGPSMVRRVSRSNPKTYTCKWVLSKAQLVTFEAWFRSSSEGINGGASWFSFSGPFGAVVGRFTEPPSIAPAGLHWELSGKLEVLPA